MVGGFSRGVVALLLLGAFGPLASAQDAVPKAALMRTATDQEGLRGALDRIARSALDDLDVAEVTGTLALDLEQAQLALGCMAVSAECLGTVARENEVALLLAPRLEDTGDERVLTIVLYDERDQSVNETTRRIAAGEGNDAVLDAVPGLLRELFGLPPVEEATPALGEPGDGRGSGAPANGDDHGAQGTEPPEAEGLGAGGPVLLGVGGAALVGAIVAGILASNAESDYAAIDVGADPAAAEEAGKRFDEAQTRARTATGLFIGGGVLAAGGLIWLLVDLMGGDEEDESTARLLPRLGFGQGVEAGLTLEMSL